MFDNYADDLKKAQNPETSTIHLYALAHSPSLQVKFAVFYNPNVSKETWLWLLEEHYSTFAANPFTDNPMFSLWLVEDDATQFIANIMRKLRYTPASNIYIDNAHLLFSMAPHTYFCSPVTNRILLSPLNKCAALEPKLIQHLTSLYTDLGPDGIVVPYLGESMYKSLLARRVLKGLITKIADSNKLIKLASPGFVKLLCDYDYYDLNRKIADKVNHLRKVDSLPDSIYHTYIPLLNKINREDNLSSFNDLINIK